jgi:hypothetical protein
MCESLVHQFRCVDAEAALARRASSLIRAHVALTAQAPTVRGSAADTPGGSTSLDRT